jgi:hypothetical protein
MGKNTANPDGVFLKIVKKTDRYFFGEGGPYAHEGKTWTKLIDKYRSKTIIKLSEGNQGCKGRR